MDSGLTLLISSSTPTNTNTLFAFQFISNNPLKKSTTTRIIQSPLTITTTTTTNRRKPRKVLLFASKKDELDEWDKMELQFGRMIGEDPKFTLAKIMGRKSNPDMSYLEIEKLLDNNNKGKPEIEEVPFDLFDDKKPTKISFQGLNLVRPVPKKGTKFQAPVTKPVEKRNVTTYVQPTIKETKKSSIPNVILRKPSSFNDEDGGTGKPSRFGMKPNLSLKMGKEQQKERFSDITLLKKPEPISTCPPDSGDEKAGIIDIGGEKNINTPLTASPERSGDAVLLQRPELLQMNLSKEGERECLEENVESISSNIVAENLLDTSTTSSNLSQSLETRQTDSVLSKGSATVLQAEIWSGGKTIPSDGPIKRTPLMPTDTVLVGKPKRLDPSSRGTDHKITDGAVPMNPGSSRDPMELENFLATHPIKEREEDDWARAEKLVETGERVEVELISSSTRGFVVSFGSLIGFLPYRNLAARWKFLAFESWLRRKGLDPSIYRQNLGIIGKYDASNMTDPSELGVGQDIDSNLDDELSSDMKLEDLLMIYDQEKLKFLSSFVGQRVKVGVVLADRYSRKLIFSIKQKEKEELVERKRSLMAQLSVGDVVKGCIKKITYFGIFVEVEGVPALIHQTEVSWDATLDPASYFKLGQIVEAKVHQLDFSLGRIFLSLKEITPDPLTEALEAVVGDRDSLAGGFEAAEAKTEWTDVEFLIRELEQFDGIQSVSKGRYFLSPGLAPTFQVYMASMFENQYKLLARAGNRVQEIIVQASLGKEELKSAIMTCTNRVE